jgi:antitoxin (DNA-binding transcriptional repressor) of toxin-antitoxin stability system
MRSAGIRDLKNNLSKYLRHLQAGETLQVTDRGRVVAELRAPASGANATALTGRYEQLVQAGVIRRAQEGGDPLADWPTARQVRLPRGTAARLVDEDRGG